MVIKTKKTITLLIATMLAFSLYNLSVQAFVPGYTATLSVMNSGVSEYVDHTTWGGVIHLEAPGNAATEVNEGRIVIVLPDGTELGDIESISWDVYTVMGYPPHADLILDIDGDGDNHIGLSIKSARRQDDLADAQGFANASEAGATLGDLMSDKFKKS